MYINVLIMNILCLLLDSKNRCLISIVNGLYITVCNFMVIILSLLNIVYPLYYMPAEIIIIVQILLMVIYIILYKW